MSGTLYMVPSHISDVNGANDLPQSTTSIISSLRHFVVENVRTVRRFLKSVDKQIDIDGLTMCELSEHTPDAKIPEMLAPAIAGENIGMVSEAGCPGVADPGATLAAEAHRRGIRVVPLVGPSSLLMALMASGLNGQNFAFRGYLPIGTELVRALRQMEERSQRENQTQIFIEAPYRNDKMLDALLSSLHAETRLCIARNVMGADELIVTHKVSEWRKLARPSLHKIPTVFLFLA